MSSKAADKRFASLKSDPRFRKQKADKFKVEIDDRFKSVLDEGGVFAKERGPGAKAKTDKYGRAVSENHSRDQLRKFYRMGDESKGKAVDAGEEGPAFVDYARGEGVLESSGSEDDSDDDDLAQSESEAEDEIIELGAGRRKKPTAQQTMSDDSDFEVDLDEDAMPEEHDPAALQRLQEQADAFASDDEAEAEPTTTEQTNRLAVVNLDWDHVHAADLYKIFSSVLQQGGTSSKGEVVSVRVYPSEFGKKRMEKEELEGPPKDVFRKKGERSDDESEEEYQVERLSDAEDDDEEEEEEEEMGIDDLVEEGEGEQIDMDRLRKYQLERLRYYYAVATFSSVQAAAHIHAECEGTEFERTANVFDLRFVPDEMNFDEDFRDEATEAPALYKGLDFVTDALRHSSVKLTWDDDAPERTKVTRRKLSRKEIDEQDYSAFLASGSESEGEESRNRLRELLLGNLGSRRDDGIADGFGGDADMMSDDDGGGDGMEITFAPALAHKDTFGQEEDREETTLEAYKRKMREKKKAKKESRAAATEADGEDGTAAASKSKQKKDVADGDDFFGDSSDSDDEAPPPPSSKGSKKDKGASRTADDSAAAADKNQALLDLVALPTPAVPGAAVAVDDSKHFSMADILKDEKNAGKKKRKRAPHGGKLKEKEKDVELGDRGFEINVKDERFSKKLNEDHRFAIDPSNPHFKKTKAMTKILEERSRLRDEQGREGPQERKSGSSSQNQSGAGDVDLDSLVKSVKRKVGNAAGQEGGGGKTGGGKRRRR